jgi:hypothetical protein
VKSDSVTYRIKKAVSKISETAFFVLYIEIEIAGKKNVMKKKDIVKKNPTNCWA